MRTIPRAKGRGSWSGGRLLSAIRAGHSWRSARPSSRRARRPESASCRACRLVGLSRATARYRPTRPHPPGDLGPRPKASSFTSARVDQKTGGRPPSSLLSRPTRARLCDTDPDVERSGSLAAAFRPRHHIPSPPTQSAPQGGAVPSRFGCAITRSLRAGHGPVSEFKRVSEEARLLAGSVCRLPCSNRCDVQSDVKRCYEQVRSLQGGKDPGDTLPFHRVNA